MSLREIWRAAFARGEARGVAQGAAFRAEVAARLDDEREEREARIRAEAYAQGREVGIAYMQDFCERENAITEKRGVAFVRPHEPCAGGVHAWDVDAHWCDCGALERF